MKIDLSINKIIKIINEKKARIVLFQFPEGLKKYSTKIVDKISKKTNAEIFIWLNSCYGSCDIPLLGKLNRKFDLVFSFGHTLWPFQNKVKAKEI